MNEKQQYAPPPPYGFNPQAQTQEPARVVITHVQGVRATPVGPDTTRLTCPSCQAAVSSRTEKESTTKTHLFALLLCVIFCPCVCVPYCCDCCKATNHYCPNCGNYLGTYDP